MPPARSTINIVDDGEMESPIISDVSPLQTPVARQRTWPRRNQSEEIEGVEEIKLEGIGKYFILAFHIKSLATPAVIRYKHAFPQSNQRI